MNPPAKSSKSIGRNNRRMVVAAIVVVFVVGLPVMNAFGLVGSGSLNQVGRYLCCAILAISMDLLFGYSGLLSLSQTLFFAFGGYLSGLYLVNASGTSAANAGWSLGFPAMAGLGLVAPGLLAAAFGYLVFRPRINGVYFAVLTQALAIGGLLLVPHLAGLGGAGGLNGFSRILGADLHADATQRGLFAACAIALVTIYAACDKLGETRLGLVLRALRDGESRMLVSGYAAEGYRLFAFVVAAVIAAVGGALFVGETGSISPAQLAPSFSFEVLAWVIIGGRGTLVGPVIGAIVVSAAKDWLLSFQPDLWFACLGAGVIACLLFLPGGLASLPRRLTRPPAKPPRPDPAATRAAGTGPAT